MTTKQIDAHEYKHRKGDKSKGKPKIWQEHYDAMASKTVLRNMIGKWGLMSIDYMREDAQTLQFAQDIAAGTLDGEDAPLTIEQKTFGNPLLVQPSAVTTPAAQPVTPGEEKVLVGVPARPDQYMGEQI